jgi:hypothetical protein
MLTLKRVRQLVPSPFADLDDANLEILRKRLYDLAEIAVESLWLEVEPLGSGKPVADPAEKVLS